ncbi:MAG: LptF/LptG family permease, partial [candidate division NC10 bacterium]
MKIFTRYMVGRFFRPFLFGLGIFALLIFLGDMFDKLNYLVKSKASMLLILQYLWLEVPYWSVRVIPMATLLATLVAITGFVQSGEWLAVQASGFQTKAFWQPVLLCSLAVTLLSFAAQETVLPACFSRARRLWQDKIHPEWEWTKYLDIALVGGPGRFLQAKLFLPKEGKLERPTLEKLGPEGLDSQLDAKLALWDKTSSRWVFFDGVERRFALGVVHESPFDKKISDFDVPPRNLIPRTTNPDEMSLREMKVYADRMTQLGVPR